MATALVKSKLKAAREAIQAKDYGKAELAASDVLTFDAANYNGRVFLAVAKLNLNKPKEAEEAYKTATEAQPATLLAWQGLASLYEKTDRWSDYIETQYRLADLAKQADDATKCAEALQKILQARRQHESPEDVLSTLKLFLPDSTYYGILSNLPAPDATAPEATTTYEAQSLIQNSLPILTEMVAHKEKNEQSQIATETDKRRKRLTTTTSAEETRRIVMREVMSVSGLPDLYDQVLQHHMAGDELRRETEHKLLTYLHTLLLSLPSPFASTSDFATTSEAAQADIDKRAKSAGKQKDTTRKRIEDLAQGMVTLRIGDELAWRIVTEWKDMKDDEDWDDYTLKRYMEVFPDSGLARLLHLVLGLPDPNAEPADSGAKSESKPALSLEDRLSQVEVALEATQASSLRAHVMASSFFLDNKDFQSASETAEAGLSFLKRLEGDVGRKMTGTRVILERTLATSLVHFNPPSHHMRALRLLEQLLQMSPNDYRCLLAKGYIHSQDGRYESGYDLFTRVFEESGVSDAMRFEARVERVWCLGNIEGRTQEALDDMHQVLAIVDEDKEIDRFRKALLWWRYGYLLARMHEQRSYEASLNAFVESIKRDNTYAPAFTSLGFYYRDHLDPPDYEYSLQCFQKAFELDETQDVAAEVLAHEYALEGEWDLVEVVARRVVQVDRFGASKVSAQNDGPAASKRKKTHFWAWKAIGAADLKSKRYTQAITSLQYATRGDPGDVSCWLQLSQAYRGAGKHVASLKTLARVIELEPENWHARYLIGDTQRQIGLFEASLSSFDVLVQSRPDELVVKVALAETYLLLAASEVRNGFTNRATDTLRLCTKVSLEIVQGETGSRIAWKLIADSLLWLGKLVRPDEEEEDLRSILSTVLDILITQGIDSRNPLLTVITAKSMTSRLDGMGVSVACTAMAVLSYSMRMLLDAQEQDSVGPSWFDLGFALHWLQPLIGQVDAQTKESLVNIQSIQCLRNALQKEPLNGQFWNLLGVLATDATPKLAQHALIRACELNLRSAIPWTNLGVFYLKHEDYDLSNRCFLRAQVLDPDYPQAWLGQAALAKHNGDMAQANVLTDHATFLANGSVPDADLSSALNSFDAVPPTGAQRDIFVRPHFLTSRYIGKNASSATALHAHGLLSERLSLNDQALDSFAKAAELLEAEYELNEEEEIERRYTVANASLARARLAVQDYGGALQAVEFALGLLQGAGVSGEATQIAVLRVQCLLAKALASFFLNDSGACFEAFEAAQAGLESLEQGTELAQKWRSQATLLLTGVLHCIGGDEQRAEAEQQLLDNIYDVTTNNPNIPVISALSAMAIVTENAELLEAALAEIVKLPVDQQVSQDQTGDIAYLLASHKRLQNDEAGVAAVYAHALHSQPAAQHAQRAFAVAIADPTEIPDKLRVMQHKIHRHPSKESFWYGLED